MSRISQEEDRDRLRDILEAIESGEIVIKQAADDVIQEIEDRMSGDAESAAA